MHVNSLAFLFLHLFFLLGKILSLCSRNSVHLSSLERHVELFVVAD